ncbi:NnrU family protein [Thioalkalivibrio sp. HK1]|uniref:NnrU family protein n=1 Tax=Thioalkalivibrio sp. HK1 TaxID=1469245 RepID=UPI00046FE05D|nr:NnrU family protein [Thioalkalivibrio sp. HK1]
MTSLIIGLVLFLGVHSVSIVAPAWRDRTAERLGHGWRAIYSVISIIGFVLIINGYGDARAEGVYQHFWGPSPSLSIVSSLLMLFVFPLFLAAYFPGRIKARIKHPMLAATKVWAFAHLLANGTAPDLLLFGGFLVWSVGDLLSMRYRTPRAIPALPPKPLNDVIVIVGGLALYALFVFLHPLLIGVPVG